MSLIAHVHQVPRFRTVCLQFLVGVMAVCLMKNRDDFALPYSGLSNYDARNVLLKVSGQELISALSPVVNSVI